MSETVPDSPIRVFLLLENRLLREALDRRLRKRADLLVVGRSGKEDCSLQILLETQCDVLVVDFLDARWLPVSLGRKTGKFSALKSLLIGMSGDFEQFLAAIRGGATGYLLKEASTSEVVAAVRSTFRGEADCPSKLCGALFQYVSQMTKDSSCRNNSVARILA